MIALAAWEQDALGLELFSCGRFVSTPHRVFLMLGEAQMAHTPVTRKFNGMTQFSRYFANPNENHISRGAKCEARGEHEK
jgi:hypothetical protein